MQICHDACCCTFVKSALLWESLGLLLVALVLDTPNAQCAKLGNMPFHLCVCVCDCCFDTNACFYFATKAWFLFVEACSKNETMPLNCIPVCPC
uniref:Putative secreted protein n=1 Tax=Ixodes ricinus TaxID=34613 RepID=A0A147BQI6_IXORI